MLFISCSYQVTSKIYPSVLVNARPYFDLWSSIPARIPAAGLGHPKLPSTNWMVWQPKGVWISVSHLKALATLLGYPQADYIGSQPFPVSFNIIVLALCVGFLFIMVYWSEQQFLILLHSSGASCFQCWSCSCSSYCAVRSCNCSQVLLEASIGTAAATLVTVAIRTFAATVADDVLPAPCFFLRSSESVSYWQQPCCTHSPSQVDWLCLWPSQEVCWYQSTGKPLITVSTWSEGSNATQGTTTKPLFLA